MSNHAETRAVAIPLGDGYVECSHGCPFVIHGGYEWEHHLGWHAEMALPIAERYPSEFDGPQEGS